MSFELGGSRVRLVESLVHAACMHVFEGEKRQSLEVSGILGFCHILTFVNSTGVSSSSPRKSYYEHP